MTPALDRVEHHVQRAIALDGPIRIAYLSDLRTVDREVYEAVLARFADSPTVVEHGADTTAVGGPQPAGDPLADDLTGQQLDAIQVVAPIGQGGMGLVYRGFDRRLRRAVAIKTLRHGLTSPVTRARFVREARILSSLSHPNICQVYDLMTWRDRDVLVLELIEGETLRRAAHRLDEHEKLRVAEQVAQAIVAAHREQIIHRDLKPDNIMIAADGQVKVLDFGIARSVGSAQTSDVTTVVTGIHDPRTPTRAATPRFGRTADLTETYSTAGTLAYMSPEQARSERLTLASDLFSFGVVLQELFTGQRAVPALPLDELIEWVGSGRTLVPVDLDRGLARLITDLRRRVPAERPTAEQCLARIRGLIRRPRQRQRRRRRWLAAVAFVATLGGAVTAVAHTRHEARRQSEFAQTFGREAMAIEDQLTRAYLAPAHDIRPRWRAARAWMGSVRDRLETLPEVARGPAADALGRVALALEDFPTAVADFETAWRAGYRPPEVAVGLSRARFERYRRSLSRARRIADPVARRAAIDRLRRRDRAPALRLLRTARERFATREPMADRGLAGQGSVAFVEILVAFYEERYDQALAATEAVLVQAPLAHEWYLLAGKILHADSERLALVGDEAGAQARAAQARQALSRAAAIGRSDPSVHLERCAVELHAAIRAIYGAGEASERLDEGKGACRQALRIDVESTRARVLLAGLHLRQAESESHAVDPRPHLARAAALIDEALRRERGDAATWKILGDIHAVEADWARAHSRPFGPIVEPMVAAYAHAHRLAPEDPSTSIGVGNSLTLAAHHAAHRGDDPRPLIADALTAYQRAAVQVPGSVHAFANMTLAYAQQAAWEVATGRDPTATAAAADRVLDDALAIDPEALDVRLGHAHVLLGLARRSVAQGDDPRPLVRAIVAAVDDRAARLGTWSYGLALRAESTLLEAEHGLARGVDPRPAVQETLAAVADALAASPRWGRAHAFAAGAHRVHAAWLLRRGEDPHAALGAADEAITLAVEYEPDHPRTRAEQPKIDVL